MQRDPRRYLQAVQKVIACMTLGIDVSKLFSEMIMVSFPLEEWLGSGIKDSIYGKRGTFTLRTF